MSTQAPLTNEMQQTMKQLMDNVQNCPNAVIDFIAANPAIARTDQGWNEFFPYHSPWILVAATRNQPCVMQALLAAGASPNARDSFGHSLLQYLVNQDPRSVPGHSESAQYKLTARPSPEDADMLEMLLDHPDFDLQKHHVNNNSTIPVMQMADCMEPAAHALEVKRCALFDRMLHMTPDSELVALAPSPFSEALLRADNTWKDMSLMTRVSIIRSLVNRGLDLNDYPLHNSFKQPRDGHSGEIAALLAAGLKERPMGEDSILSSQFRTQAGKILDTEMLKVRSGEAPPSSILFTPQGRASWQARGMATHNKLNALFAPENREIFGGESQQLTCAMRLGEALPEHYTPYFDIRLLQRDRQLARPATTATVVYARGGGTDRGVA